MGSTKRESTSCEHSESTTCEYSEHTARESTNRQPTAWEPTNRQPTASRWSTNPEGWRSVQTVSVSRKTPAEGHKFHVMVNDTCSTTLCSVRRGGPRLAASSVFRRVFQSRFLRGHLQPFPPGGARPPSLCLTTSLATLCTYWLLLAPRLSESDELF